MTIVWEDCGGAWGRAGLTVAGHGGRPLLPAPGLASSEARRLQGAFSSSGSLPVEYLMVPVRGRAWANDIKIQFQRRRWPNAPGVYLLDGLARRRDDFNGWDINTAAFRVVPRLRALLLIIAGRRPVQLLQRNWYKPACGQGAGGCTTYKWEDVHGRGEPACLPGGQQGCRPDPQRRGRPLVDGPVLPR